MQTQSALFRLLDAKAFLMEQEIADLKVKLAEADSRYNDLCHLAMQAGIDSTTILTKVSIAADGSK